VTAYPGICAADQECWGNPRGQVHQWFYTSDTSYRASVMYGGESSPVCCYSETNSSEAISPWPRFGFSPLP
jgi:hypothetical protein